MVWLIIKFLFFIYLLAHSGAWLVKLLSRLAGYFKVSYFAVAFIIMAAATSVPELLVGINSALDKTSTLSLGVVLGSNIADLALVFGVILILAKTITLESTIAKKDAYYMVLIAILPLILLYDRTLSRTDGLILLLAFGLYSYAIFWSKQKFFKAFHLDNNHIPKLMGIAKNFFYFLIGLGLLLISAKYVVDYGNQLALALNLPLILIGISVLALSTSLPELVFEWKAIGSGKKEMALGDLIGSVVTNSALVLGITALIYPIEIRTFSVFLIAAVYFLLLLVFFLFNLSKPLGPKTGIFLILSYIIFLVLEFY